MYWSYPPYVSVAEKKERAKEKLKKLLKKNPNMKPVVIDGKSISNTWWGKAWNSNLEKYADYSNRIGRGRSYVRHGSVLDLQISKGKIKSLVQGSSTRPYKVEVQITSLVKSKWDNIKKASKAKIDSLQELLAGKFPKNLGEIFTTKDKGLFPAPKEIKLSCSCPDWAVMCKHVAATLYGVGARLDESPELFFSLRGVNVNDLIQFAVRTKKDDLLKSASKRRKESRIIEKDDSTLSTLFDIDLDAKEILASKVKRKKKASTKKKVVKKKTVTAKKKKVVKKKVVKKKIVKNVTKKKKFTKKKKKLKK